MADVGQAHEDAVAQFVALTGSSTDQAAFMLEATQGNLEQAVQMYLGECASPSVNAAYCGMPTLSHNLQPFLCCICADTLLRAPVPCR